MICRYISEGKIELGVLTNFNNHPYWLIRKLAIEEIINHDGRNTLDMLYEFKNVSYHVSQALIREYIERKMDAKSFSQEDIQKVVVILDQMSTAKKVSDISKKKDLRLLEKLSVRQATYRS